MPLIESNFRTHKDDSLMLPRVNINGTSREELSEGFAKAQEAILTALEAVAATRPHGRDFQTCEPGDYNMAMRQHLDRLMMLNTLAEEMEQLATEVK